MVENFDGFGVFDSTEGVKVEMVAYTAIESNICFFFKLIKSTCIYKSFNRKVRKFAVKKSENTSSMENCQEIIVLRIKLPTISFLFITK